MTKMRRSIRFVAVILVSLAYPAISCYGQKVDDAAIKTAIRNLTSVSDSDSPEVFFGPFYSSPERGTELLLAALRPVKRGKYATGHHPQVVWIIRALRSLTGLDFTARTAMKLSDDESNFLDSEADGSIRFFGTWMSRDSVWVAPPDAQVAIIGKWKSWFAQHRHNYKYVNDTKFDHWYF